MAKSAAKKDGKNSSEKPDSTLLLKEEAGAPSTI